MKQEPLLTIDPFVGHRVWRVIPLDGEPVLGAAVNGDPWLARDQRAECHAGVLLVPRDSRVDPRRHSDEPIPALGCTCGIYASRLPGAPPHRRVWAAGQVRLWGRVVEGTKGFRAERARVAGDVSIMLGMGPGPAKCTSPACRAPADRVWAGAGAYMARCADHGAGRAIPAAEFVGAVDGAFRRRYGIGASLAHR